MIDFHLIWILSRDQVVPSFENLAQTSTHGRSRIFAHINFELKSQIFLLSDNDFDNPSFNPSTAEILTMVSIT